MAEHERLQPERFETERQRILGAYDRRRRQAAAGYFELEDEAHAHRLAERYRLSRRLLARHGLQPLTGRRVLDVGCGTGDFGLELLQWGAEPDLLAGIDLRPEPLELAHHRLPRSDLRHGCASQLPWPDGHFDLVCQHTVFSSILDPAMRAAVAGEMARVVRGSGAILWYDTRRANPHNPDVRPIDRQQIRQLFPAFDADIRRLTFLPHVARRLPPAWLDLVYPLLGTVPAWRSHLLALLSRP